MFGAQYKKEIRDKYFDGHMYPTRDAIAEALSEEEDVIYRLFLQQMLINCQVAQK